MNEPFGDLSAMDKATVEAFHKLYYMDHQRTWDGPTTYKSHKILKNPMDLWIYQEIIYEMRPQLVVECGTAHGGSALWFADQLKLAEVSNSKVITIDIELPKFFPDRPVDPAIIYLNTSSVAPDTVDLVHRMAAGKRTLVVLDSAHIKDHVVAELDAYSDLTPVGGWLIVEDTNVHGNPVLPTHAEGPMEALKEWLPKHSEFLIDESKHKFLLTFNPNGYLKRVS